MTKVLSPDNGSPRVSRRTVVFSLALAAVGGAVVSCAGPTAAPVPANGQVAAPASGGQSAANAATIPTQPPSSSSSMSSSSAPTPAAAEAVPTDTALPATAVPTATLAPQPTATEALAPTATAAKAATTPTSTPPTATSAPVTTKVPTATTVPAPAVPRPTTTTVEMTDQFRFSPSSVTIPKGSTIVWKNVGSQPHTVTCDPTKAMNKADIALPSGAQPFSSDFLMGGQSYSHTFTVAGTYRYVCIPHEAMGMLGTVIVE